MHKLASKYLCYISITAFFFLFSTQLIAQERSLRVIGTVENDMEPVPRAKVNLFKDGNSVEIIFTKPNGEFLFDLEINHEYLIEVSGAGFLTKRIAFNTELPDDIFGKWTMEFAMSLFKGCEGVTNTTLDDPVDRIKYSTNKSDFISDIAYVQRMRGRIEGLLIDIEKCHNDKFEDLIKEADELNRENKPEEARAKYEEALKIIPDDRITQRKVDEINKRVGETQENQQVFSTAINEADRLFAEKQYEAAREKYNEALRAMPQNNYPREKVAEIDKMNREKTQLEEEELTTERKYNSLVAQGNAAYTAKNFVAAKTYYEQALLVKPGASFPTQRVSELGPAIEMQKQATLNKASNDKAYNEALAMGQSAMQSKNYDLAKQHFNKALTIKPEESYPKQMISEIDNTIASQQAEQLEASKAITQKKIDAALDEGDAMFKAKNYSAAANAYQRALQLAPQDSYTKDRLNKSKSMMAAADAEKQRSLEKMHQAKIDEADALVATASYTQAIAVYKQALLAKPNDAILQNKLANAEYQLAAEQQQKNASAAKKKEYDQLLAQGNNYFSSKQYTNAKLSFSKATVIFPDQPYPRTKIQEIDALLAKNQKEQEYNGIITKADNLMASKDYIQAKSVYQQALTLKAGDAYAQQKVAEIDALLDKNAKDKQYRTQIIKADNLMASKDYVQAKTFYQQALALKTNDTYSRQKIAEIDGLIRENERLASEQEAKDEQYSRAIQEADNLFSLVRLPEAKAAYQRALALKANETYPREQISKIDARIVEQTRLENAKKAKEQQYTDLISKGNALFAAKNYSEAKTVYQQALALNPAEGYPKQKIAEIDGILGQQQKQAAEQKALDQRYNQIVMQADNLYKASKFAEAKSAYQEASSLKPVEPYPKTQISKIEAKIAEQTRLADQQRTTEFKYKEAITMADRLYGQNDLEGAKTQYEKALSFKPNETYPTGQIVKINGQLAQIDKTRQEKAAYEQRYNSVITEADKAYDSRDYVTAKAKYMQALSMKSSETYPQQRLNKIAEFERIIAQKEAAKNAAVAAATTSTATETSARPSKLASLDFVNDSERDKYLDALKKDYPQGVTLEIHKEKISTIERFVVYRGNEIREFRKVKFSWGTDYSMNGKPITEQYFKSQVKVREGEYFKEIKL